MNKHVIYTPSSQAFIAGLALSDNNIEFIGKTDNKSVIFLQNGKVKPFKELDNSIYKKLLDAYLKDKEAVKIITLLFPEIVDKHRQVELYTYYIYGDLDSTPDVIEGKLQPSENFREKDDCISLGFNSKNIDFKGAPLKSRYVKMLDAWSNGYPDKMIASDILGVALTTYDFHKSKLFKIMDVSSKTQAISQAYKYHILCAQ